MVRVVVARTSATVPGCPNWSKAATPTFDNAQLSNFGCGVNSNLAAMVANPQDLVSGREGSGVGDTRTASKAVEQYRKAVPTGQSGLKDISTKGN
jgi:pilus assembly protein CpaD